MRHLLAALDFRFQDLHEGSLHLLAKLNDDELFIKPRELAQSMAMFSCGEYLLRSAAAVEQTSLGITTRLWDDPFEWTLPEKLSTCSLVESYLNDVEQSRKNAFGFLKTDDELRSLLPAPETLTGMFDLLLRTLSRASHFQGRAYAVFQMVSDQKLPRLSSK